MTSALAHEINQPLAAMRSYAQAALRFLDAEVPDPINVRKALEGIVADNKRASAVVNRLRDLVKKKMGQNEILSINQMIDEVIMLINSEIVMRNTTIETDLDPSSPIIYGDPVQIQQVLMNLLNNAMDAMDDIPISERTIKIHSRVDADNNIRISIVDHGKGIAPEKLKNIFLPFHTTKVKGLGLGLAISKSIINAHDGSILAENNSHGGATFVVTLPAAGMQSDQQIESGGTNATI
jgi:C4-dicarboxylate-specific signal transduction histidine kinase